MNRTVLLDSLILNSINIIYYPPNLNLYYYVDLIL